MESINILFSSKLVWNSEQNIFLLDEVDIKTAFKLISKHLNNDQNQLT